MSFAAALQARFTDPGPAPVKEDYTQYEETYEDANGIEQTRVVPREGEDLAKGLKEYQDDYAAWRDLHNKWREQKRQDERDALPAGVIVGIVIACVVAVLLIGLILFFCLRKDRDLEDPSMHAGAVDDGFHVQSKPLLAKPPKPPQMEWEYVPPAPAPVYNVAPARARSPPPQPAMTAAQREQLMVREKGDRFSITGEDTVHIVHR
jgi:hypothetical protein